MYFHLNLVECIGTGIGVLPFPRQRVQTRNMFELFIFHDRVNEQSICCQLGVRWHYFRVWAIRNSSTSKSSTNLSGEVGLSSAESRVSFTVVMDYALYCWMILFKPNGREYTPPFTDLDRVVERACFHIDGGKCRALRRLKPNGDFRYRNEDNV
jgi:hypothetical protein